MCVCGCGLGLGFRSLRPLPLQDFVAAVAVPRAASYDFMSHVCGCGCFGFRFVRCGRCRAASYDFMSHV